MRNYCLCLMMALVTLCVAPRVLMAQDSDDVDLSDYSGETIVSIEFSGNMRVEGAALAATLLSKKGKLLDLSRVQNDVRAIWSLGVFLNVVVRAESVDDGVRLIFQVTEKSSIRKIFVSGHDGLSLDKINEAIELKRDSILDVSKVKKNQENIRTKYVEEGYYLAEVDYEVRPVSDGEVDVWYFVKENAKVSIQDVSFVGNKAIPDTELRNIIQTRKGGALSFLSDSGTFQQEIFDRDLVMLQAYYYDKGYWAAKIGAPALKLSRDKTYMYLSVPVEEGPRFKVGSIDFKGDLMGPKKAYYEKLTTKVGEYFSRSTLAVDIEGLTNFYKDKGFAYVNVQPNMPMDTEKLTVALTFEIEKGSKVFFERINIRGNSTTRDKVIRREMNISEGELYNQSKMDVSERRINALGFFETVNISSSRGSSEEYVEVNVEISERPTGTFQIGAGFSSIESFILQAQIQKNNLFGRGQTLALNTQLSSLRRIFSFSFVEPYFLDSKVNMGVSLFNQVQGFGQATFARNSVGGRTSFGYPFTFETRGSLAYKLERVSVFQWQFEFDEFWRDPNKGAKSKRRQSF